MTLISKGVMFLLPMEKDNISEINGKGNLIVGSKSADVKANPGYHNVIIGFGNKYSSYGGIVAGFENQISGNYAYVTGGWNNIASGYISSISGGYANIASSGYSSVSGGYANEAAASYSSVPGGNTTKPTVNIALSLEDMPIMPNLIVRISPNRSLNN